MFSRPSRTSGVVSLVKRERLRSLHLCAPECEQVVKGLDLRMLRTWLGR